jgi:dipeptidyl aminopeptidase/acylaminoacyl peptidase
MTLVTPEHSESLRRSLLAPEENTSVRLSPDGRQIAFVRTADAGQEVWVQAAHGARKLAAHPGRTVRDLRWTSDATMVAYLHAEHGREAWAFAAVPAAGGPPTSVTLPWPVTEYWLPATEATAVACACRVPGARHPALFVVGLPGQPEGEPAQVAANPGYHRWLVDGCLRPRGGIRLQADGSAEVVLGVGLSDARPLLRIDAESLAGLSVQRFSRDGSQLFIVTAAGSPTGNRRLLALTVGGDVTTVFEHPSLDMESYPIAGDGVWFDPVSGEPDICSVMDQRLRHHFLSPARPEVAARLAATPDRSTVIVDRSADDQVWLIGDVHDSSPLRYYRYEPAIGRSQQLIVNRPGLVGRPLARLEDFCFTASDGRAITGYAMRPPAARTPLPGVMLIHGGPAGRDIWRFHAEAQYLASLGYLSLHVNYRGSRGFGTEFRRAGNGEWGGRMQHDLYEAVAHAVAAGLLDPARVAFFGASYGGYAALLAACTRHDLVRCAIAISAPCDLVSFAARPPAYWRPLAGALRDQILRTADGRPVEQAVLERRSPTRVLNGRCAPVLLAHGARDPRVPVAEADAFTDRATGVGTAVRYLRFGDEGHLVRSQHNREVLYREVSKFLEAHLVRAS